MTLARIHLGAVIGSLRSFDAYRRTSLLSAIGFKYGESFHSSLTGSKFHEARKRT